MKASIKFREDQKPLARVKVPISILGLPFSTAVSSGGDPTDLRFDLSTSSNSGAAVRVSYRPNDARNPFSVVLKTGTSSLGSPTSAPMSMSAEFSLLSPRGGPTFVLHFKPRFGDFSFDKTVASSAPLSAPPPLGINGSGGGAGAYAPVRANGFQGAIEYPVVRGIDGILSGAEIMARSVLPLKDKATVRFRWGVRLPSELPFPFGDEESGGVGVLWRKRPGSWIPSRDLPLLVMRKISIEQMPNTADKGKSKQKDSVAVATSPELGQLVAEQGALRKAVEELRMEVERWKGRSVEDRCGGDVATRCKNGRSATGGGKEKVHELKQTSKGAGGN